jgi:hypothetical protein
MSKQEMPESGVSVVEPGETRRVAGGGRMQCRRERKRASEARTCSPGKLGRSVLRPTLGSKKRRGPDFSPGLSRLSSKMGISGDRRREGRRLHRGIHHHRRHREVIHRRRCCAERCHPSCGLVRARSCEPEVIRSESVQSTSAATDSLNADSNTSVTEIRSSGPYRFRSRGQTRRSCSRGRSRWPS